MTQIVPGFVLGNAKAMADPRMLQENKIDAIVSLLPKDSQPARRFESRKSEIRDIIPEDRHKWIDCHDSNTQDLLVHMSDICDFIDKMACPELSFLSSVSIPVTGEQAPVRDASESTVVDAPGTPTSSAPAPNPTAAVLIHCAAGKSRSPTIVIAYLMRKLRIPFNDAIKFVKSKQKVKPNRGFLRQLEVWDQVEYEIWEDEEKTVPKAAYKAFLGEQEALFKERELKKTLQPESAKL
ncbi:dual specificity phosphatase [Penicillium herquei]|nr:dual specificity phosphatase [Penicillium herquei]